VAQILRFRRRRKRPPQRGLFEDTGARGPAAPDARRASSDAVTVGPPPSDAETLAGEDRGLPGDPEAERRRRQRFRRRAAVVGAIFTLGVGLAVFGERGYLDVRRSRDAQAALREEVHRQQVRVDRLQREVARLRTDPAAIERIAREDLGLARPGEIVLALPSADGDPLESDDAFAIVPGLPDER